MNFVAPALHCRTKIVATLGPASSSPQTLVKLIRAGVDVFRLNMAHGSREQHEQQFNDIRAASREAGRPVGVLVDLAGPKIRLKDLPGDEYHCQEGGQVRFVRGEPQAPGEFATTYEPLIDDLNVGDRVMLADGIVSLCVVERTDDYAVCDVIQEGVVRSRQGVNLPGVKLRTPAMTEVDRENAVWAAQVGADFIGLSFVRRAEDVHQLRRLLVEQRSRAKIIAKIEKPEALECLEEIVGAADGAMVARGDLGVEIDVARIGVVQKQVISLCNRMQKPVIVATQMLESMHYNLRPTRAEATDVANAVLDGADACMLSGETAVGQHPVEAVAMMQRIALETEQLFYGRPPRDIGRSRIMGLHPITQAVVQGASQIARHLEAALIVVASHSGATALAMSNQRNYVPVIGISDDPQTLRHMCLFWGVTPLENGPVQDSAALAQFIEAWGRQHKLLSPGQRILLVRGTSLGASVHNLMVVHEVGGQENA